MSSMFFNQRARDYDHRYVVRQIVDVWLVDYNTEQPHQALKFMTQVEYPQAA